ncbi:MAG TPA: S41 family peptidase [Gemmatimonadales bacterium]|nr:S41 family peptidase [Gemmatimonadales bacterium]
MLVVAGPVTAQDRGASQVPDSATLDRLVALGDLYGAVFYFHPEVAPSDSARRAWDDAVVTAVEAILQGGASAFRPTVGALLETLDDPETGLLGTVRQGPATPMRQQRAWRYRGYPPEVNDYYGGPYKPFAAGWHPLGNREVQRHRLDLGGVSAVVRYSEPVPASSDTAPEPRARGSGMASEASLPERGRRVIAAYRVRNIVRYFFPYSSLTGEDWSAVLRGSIPKLLAARDSLQYALTVAELITHFHDSHVGLSGGGWSAFVTGARAPLGVRILNGEAVVVGFTGDSVGRATGLRVGDVVLAVDGEPVTARAARLARHFSSSTPQSRNNKVGNALLGVGPRGSTVRLKVRDSTGMERQVVVERTSEDRWQPARERQDRPVVQRIAEGVGYVDLARLGVEQVDSAFTALADTRAIIFDMRGYPRGTAWSIAPRLARSDSIVHARAWTRIATSPDTMAAAVLDTRVRLPPREGARPYRGRTVMLIDERAQSQAEYTGMMLRAANGTLFVGTPTSGANGDITDFRLPGNLVVSFSGTGSEFPDGTRLQRRGLIPDVYVAPTPEGLRAGRDEVLERALDLLTTR